MHRQSDEYDRRASAKTGKIKGQYNVFNGWTLAVA